MNCSLHIIHSKALTSNQQQCVLSCQVWMWDFRVCVENNNWNVINWLQKSWNMSHTLYFYVAVLILFHCIEKHSFRRKGASNFLFEWFWVNENFLIIRDDSYGIGQWFSWRVSLLISESIWDQILVQIKTGIQIDMFLQRNFQCTQNYLCALHYILDVRLSLLKKKKGTSGLDWIIQKDNLFLLLPFGKKGFVVGWNQVTTSGVHF